MSKHTCPKCKKEMGSIIKRLEYDDRDEVFVFENGEYVEDRDTSLPEQPSEVFVCGECGEDIDDEELNELLADELS